MTLLRSNMLLALVVLTACRTAAPAEQDLSSQPVPEPQLKQPEPPPPPPAPFSLGDLTSMSGAFAWQGVGLSPASRSDNGELLVLMLQFQSADLALLSIERRLDGVPLEAGVDMRITAADCDGCYDLVGEGEWGLVRIRIEGMPRLTGEALNPVMSLNFGGYAGMPVEQIRYQSNLLSNQ